MKSAAFRRTMSWQPRRAEKGGQVSGGNFANDRERAAEAGRKGGESSHSAKHN